MAYISGTAKEISIDGRTFQIVGDADVNIDLGGWSNEVSMNGDGKTARIIKTPKPSKFESVSVAIDNDRNDLEFLQGKSDTGEFFDTSLTLVDDNVYYGRAMITGDVKASTKDGKVDIEFSGTGFKKQ